MELTGFKTAQGTGISVKKTALNYVKNVLASFPSESDGTSIEASNSPAINTVTEKHGDTQNSITNLVEKKLQMNPENLIPISMKRKNSFHEQSLKQDGFRTVEDNVIDASNESLNPLCKKFKGFSKVKRHSDANFQHQNQLGNFKSPCQMPGNLIQTLSIHPSVDKEKPENLKKIAADGFGKTGDKSERQQNKRFHVNDIPQSQKKSTTISKPQESFQITDLKVLDIDVKKYFQNEKSLKKMCDSSLDNSEQKCALVPIGLLMSLVNKYNIKNYKSLNLLHNELNSHISESLKISTQACNSGNDQKLSSRNSKFFHLKRKAFYKQENCKIHDLPQMASTKNAHDEKNRTLKDESFPTIGKIRESGTFDVFHSFHKLYTLKKAHSTISDELPKQDAKKASEFTHDKKGFFIKTLNTYPNRDLFSAAMIFLNNIQSRRTFNDEPLVDNDLSNMEPDDKYNAVANVLKGEIPRVRFQISDEQLLALGVHLSTLKVKISTAVDFEFDPSFFTVSKEHNLLAVYYGNSQLPLNKKGCIGKEELFRKFLECTGIKSNLVSSVWFSNHYRWIIWMLADHEIIRPHDLGGRFLLPDELLKQMKYRYIFEINKGKRSALKKIYEQDDTPIKTMILVISDIKASSSNENAMHNYNETIYMKVSDGWYEIPVEPDPPMLELCRTGQFKEGQKIITSGAQLFGTHQACSPLEASNDIRLKLHSNSTRACYQDYRLGYYKDPKPFSVKLSSISPLGGKIGCVEVVIIRNFGILYKEKIVGEFCIRNEVLEDKFSREYDTKREEKFLVIYSKSKKTFKEKKRREKIHKVKKEPVNIQTLESGSEIYELWENSNDPEGLLMSLSISQMEAFQKHRMLYNEQLEKEMETFIQSDLWEAMLGGKLPPKREVQPFHKILVRSIGDSKSNTYLILNIWHSKEENKDMFKEGSVMRIYFLTPSNPRNYDGMQLNTTNLTEFEPMSIDRKLLNSLVEPRQVKTLAEIEQYQNSNSDCFPYVDIVGIVFHIDKSSSPSMVYVTNSFLDIVILQFPRSIPVEAYKHVLDVGKMVAAFNLKMKKTFGLLPTLEVSMVSRFTSNPEGNYIKAAMKLLRSRIVDIKDLEEKAQDVLKLRLYKKR